MMDKIKDLLGGKAGKERPIWRDSNGTIRCPGQNKCEDCTDECPIHQNQLASTMWRIGMVEESIPVIEKITREVPDFYDAWNNLAVANAMGSHYRAAHDAYIKAFELRPDKVANIYGLALTSRDMGNFKECVTWCDKYKQLTGDNRLDAVRAAAVHGENSRNV